MTTPHRPFWRRLVQAVAAPKTSATAAPDRMAHAGLVSAMRPLALEQRFMFDGAAVDTAADATHAATADGVHDATAALLVPQAVEVRAADPARADGKKEVVLVDTSLANYQSLVAGVRDGVGIVEFDGSKNGLAQIACWAATEGGYDTIHILSHGSEGALLLGATRLDTAALADNHTQAELAQLGRALSADGDLLLYGCDVGDNGALLAGLAQATGADVAASTDLTGAARLGGNWTLEAQVGTIDSRELALVQYDGVLDTIHFTYGVDADENGLVSVIHRTIGGQAFTFSSAEIYDYSDGLGIYPLSADQQTIALTISVAAGYSFDLTSFRAQGNSSGGTITVTFASSNTPVTFGFSGIGTHGTLTLINGFNPVLNDVRSVTIKAAGYTTLQDIVITDVQPAPPVAVANNVTMKYDSGTAGDFITNVAGQEFSGTLTAHLDSGARVQVSYDDGTNWRDASNYTVGSIAWKDTGVTIAGSNTFQVRTVSVSGVASTAHTQTYTLDTTAPTATVATAAFSSDTGTYNSDFITKTAAQTISGTLSANLVSGDEVYVSIDNGATWDAAVATVGQSTWSIADTLTASGTLLVRVSDVAGNVSAALSQVYQYDASAPVTTFSGLSLSADTGISGTDFITNTAAQTISATLSSALAGSDILNGSLDNGATWTDITSKVSGTTLSWNGVTLTGSSTLQLMVADAAGNVSLPQSKAYTLDTSAPATPGLPDLETSSDTGALNNDNITADSTPTLSGMAENGSTVTLYDGATELGTVVAGAGGWTYTTGVLTQGDHTFTAVATDTAGNVSATSSALTITVDTVDTADPTVTSVAVPATGTYGRGGTLDFTVNFSEAVIVDTSGGTPRLQLTIGASTRYASYVSGSGSSALVFHYTVLSGDVDADGITVGALLINGGMLQDAAGNDIVTTLNSVGSTGDVKVNGTSPSITSVSAQGLDRTVKIGDEVLVNVVFDQVVSANLSNGTPSLLLETGLVDRSAVYQSGSGSNTLVFKYTVQAGDVSADLDFQSTGAMQLNGATIKSAASDDAVLTLPTLGGANSIAGQKAIVIDGVAPTIGSVTAPLDGTYTLGQNLDFTVNFSENMLVNTTGGIPRIAVTLDTGGNRYASYVSGSGSNALVFRMTVGSGQLDSTGISLASSMELNGGTLRDAAGNDVVVSLNGVASTNNVKIDGVVPTVVSVTAPANGSYKAGDVLRFTVNASEALTSSTVQDPRLVLDVGGVLRYATYVSGSGSDALLFEYTVQTGDNDSNGIMFSSLDLRGEQLTDLAGNHLNLTLNNPGSTVGVLVDTTAPTGSGIVRVGATPTNSSAVSFTVTFSEAVSGVDPSDFSLVLTDTASASIASVTQVDGRTYTVLVNTLSGIGTVRLNLNASGTGITDAAGNAISDGLTGAAYTIDRVAPSVTSVIVPSDGTYVAGQNLDFTVNFDEAVQVNTANGTPRLAVTLDTGGTVYASYMSGSGTSALVFRLSAASGQLDSNGITLGGAIELNGGILRDSIGNDTVLTLNGVASTANVTVDALDPTVASVLVPAAGSYKAGDVLSFTVNASEAVWITGSPRLALDVGGVSRYATLVPGSSTGSTLVFQYTVQVGDNDVNGISVGSHLELNGGSVKDAAGNDLNLSLNSVGNTTSVLVDTYAPTASLSLDKTSLNAQQTALLTVRFSEAVTGLDLADFTVVDGMLSGLSTVNGGITWTAILTPAVGKVHSALQVALNNAGYTDLAGNAGANTTISGSYAINTVQPAQPVLLQVDSNVEGRATVRVDALEAGSQWEYSLDGGQSWQAGQGHVVAIESPGQHMLQVRQTNAVGNMSEVAALSLEVTQLIVPPLLDWPVLFDTRSIGSGLQPLGTIFISNGAMAPSFIAQVFDAGTGDSSGFLGFGGGDGGVFGSSTLASVFGSSALIGGGVWGDASPLFPVSGLVLNHIVDAVNSGADRQVDWLVPATMFVHSDPMATLVLELTQADGKPLPAWLKFDADTGRISGKMPESFRGELSLRLTARDNQGREVTTTIQLKALDGPSARAGVSEQFARAAQQRAGQMAGQRLHA